MCRDIGEQGLDVLWFDRQDDDVGPRNSPCIVSARLYAMCDREILQAFGTAPGYDDLIRFAPSGREKSGD